MSTSTPASRSRSISDSAPAGEEIRKLYSEILQLDNQRFLLTTTAVALFSGVAGWVTTAVLRAGGADQDAPHYGITTHDVPFASTLLLLFVLIGLFHLQLSKARTIRWLAAYLLLAGSTWEWTWHKFRETRNRHVRGSLPFYQIHQTTTRTFMILLIVSFVYFAGLHILLYSSLNSPVFGFAGFIPWGVLFFSTVGSVFWMFLSNRKLLEADEHAYLKEWWVARNAGLKERDEWNDWLCSDMRAADPAGGSALDAIKARAILGVTWRLIPFLFVCYFVAYLDRVNVGFAKLQMNAALGLSEAAYGFGTGLFFISYFLLEVPSNLALARFGARLWIACMMFCWGVISALFAFVTPISVATGISTEWVFYTLRFLLGLSEAGFFPGVIFYLMLWFPSAYRASVVALFMLAVPFSSIVGAPISGAVLNLSGAGLDGWQWLFILEAVPSILMALGIVLYLTDKPADATWLVEDQKGWLEERLEAERRQKVTVSAGNVLTDRRVLACAFVYFCLNAASYGVVFFLPTIVQGFGVSNFQTGVVSALPFVFGAIGMVVLGGRSDRTLRRRKYLCIAMLLAAVGVGGAGVASAPALVLGLLCLGQVGVSAAPPLLWPIPSAFLTGTSAAVGIAAINAIGNLSGFAGPYMMGYLKDATGSFTAGLWILGGCALVGGIVAITLNISEELEPMNAAAMGAEPARAGRHKGGEA